MPQLPDALNVRDALIGQVRTLMAHEQPGVGRRAVEFPLGEEQSQTFRERRRALFLGFGGDVLRVPGRVVGTAVAVPVGADGQEIDGRTAVVTTDFRGRIASDITCLRCAMR